MLSLVAATHVSEIEPTGVHSLLVDLGKTSGYSTNTIVINSISNWTSDILPHPGLQRP